MNHRTIPLFSSLLLTLAISSASAQTPDKTKEDAVEPAVKAITISDEPKAIDPVSLIVESMRKPAKVAFDESTLNEVVQWLRETAGLTVIVNQKSLSDAGVLSSEPVSDQLNNEPLYLLLDRLRLIGVDWWLDGNVLHLASIDLEHVFTKQYNVSDLFDAGFKPDSLQATITSTVSVSSWEDVGGPASIVVLGDVLFVRQSNLAHREVAGLLAALRKHGRRTLIADPPQHDRIRKALSAPINVSFRNAALQAVVERLATESKVDIRLDVPALRDANIHPRKPTDLEVTGQELSVTLDLLASQYSLDWYLKDGALWVATSDQVEANGKTAVFDVRDLCRDEDESMALSEAIMSQSFPDSWDEVGGMGVIDFPVPGAMVIHQTERRLDSILELLENYRQALRVSKPRIRKENDPKAVIVRYYRLPTNIADDLFMQLPTMLRSETWQNANNKDAPGTIQKLSSMVEIERSGKGEEVVATIPHSVLVIHQMREVHEEIPTLIYRIKHGDATEGGFGGGMGGGMGGGGFGGGFFSIPEKMLHRERK